MRVGLLAVLVLAVLAGCSGLPGGFQPPDGPVTTDAATPPAASSETTDRSPGTATQSGAETDGDRATATRTLSADNPWGQRVVRVAVTDTARDGRNATAIAARAVAYWNANMGAYTDHAFRFELTDDVADARVEVRFVDAIDSCDGPANHTLGCARLIGPDEEARERETVRVVSNHSNSAVTGTTKHELAHLLGLDHDDDPRKLLAQRSETPVRNASERANPWYADTLAVAVAHDAIDGDRATVDSQVGHALAFYETGANGTVPRNVSFERTDQRHAADVVVTNDPATCDVDGGSSGLIEGQNYDPDGAMEVYTRTTICVDVDAEAVGWHVGNWLGAAFGLDRDELAPVFRNPTYETTHGEWWE